MLENTYTSLFMNKITSKSKNLPRAIKFKGYKCNKTPAQAFTPPAKKFIGYYNCTGREKHEVANFLNSYYFKNISCNQSKNIEILDLECVLCHVTGVQNENKNALINPPSWIFPRSVVYKMSWGEFNLPL